jgi:hypothetical protein
MNKITIADDSAVIHITKRSGDQYNVIIDKDDIDIVSSFTWHISKSGYVQTVIKKKTIFLHKLILGCSTTAYHINKNKLDNRKSNLKCLELPRFAVKDDHAEMYLYNRSHEHKNTAIIDIDDLEKVSEYSGWSINCRGYVKTKYNKKTISLHRLIMDFPENKETDHINRNPLDNRKCNLRIATRTENNINRGLHKNNTSGHRCIYWNSKNKSWVVRVYYNNTYRHVGVTKDFSTATQMLDDAERNLAP